MKILLFGGTTEGRLLAAALKERGHCVTVCVATALGAEELEGIGGIHVSVGRLPREEILKKLPAYDLCVDATHPYARQISESVKSACREAGIPLRRVLRSGGEAEGCLSAASQQEAAAFLAHTEGNILLATGAKELAAFRGLPLSRLFVRILPTVEGIRACERMGVPHRQIIAMQGPFSTELNEAILRQYGIRWFVTKDGGGAGGFGEKAEAARRAGAQLIVIERPKEQGVRMEELLRELEEVSACE